MRQAANNGSVEWTTAVLYPLAIAGYPIVAVIPGLIGVGNRLISVPFRAIVLFVSAWVIFAIGVRYRRLYNGLFWLPLGVFWFLYSVRLLLDTLYMPVDLRLNPAEYILYSIGMGVIPMLAFLVVPTASSLERARVITLWAAVVACGLLLGRGASQLVLGNAGMLWHGRLGIYTLNPIALGHLGASVVVLAAFGALRHRITGKQTVALAVATLVGLVVVTLAASRGPVLALAVVLPTLLLQGYSHGARVRVPALCAIMVGLGGLSLAVIRDSFGISVSRRIMATINPGRDWSSDPRVQLITRAWSQFSENPIFGSALEEAVSSYYPHNVVVESFMATGVIGGLAFTIAILISVYMALRLLAVDRHHGWIPLLYIQYLVGAQFSGSLYSSAAMWCLMGAVVARNSAVIVLPDRKAGGEVRAPHEVLSQADNVRELR